MRYNSFRHHSIQVYMRHGDIIVLDPRGVSKRLEQLDPALVGKTIYECTMRELAFGHHEPEFEGVGAALRHAFGEITARHFRRSSSHVWVYVRGDEARFWIIEPVEDGSSVQDVDLNACLSSRPPIYVEVGAEQIRRSLFIAPWNDPEMLGHAVLEGFRMVRSPFVEGLDTVFDRPEPKRRLALHRAARDGDVGALPPRGRRTRRKLDLMDTSGATPLMLAAQNGHEEVVSHLIELGADPHLRDNSGRSALAFAAESGHTDVVRALIECGADANEWDRFRDTPLHLAADGGHADVVESLLATRASPNRADRAFQSTPLHRAARGDHSDVVALLLDGGADADARNEHGRTPLLVAAAFGHAHTSARLIDAGADVNARDHRGETPLHRPTFFQYLDCMSLLIERGADVNAADDDGNTPLHVAASMNRDRAAALLIEAGADIEVTNDEGLTPLDLAFVNVHELESMTYVEHIEYLRARGTEHNSETAWALLEHGATIDPLRIPVGDRHVLWPHLTPPELMHDYGDLDYGKLPELLDLPDHVRQRMLEPHSELGILPVSDSMKTFSILHDAVLKDMPKLVRTLLDSGVCPETAVRGYATPLHVAAAFSNFEIAQILLDYGADLEMPASNAKDGRYDYNRRGRTGHRMETPLDTAIEMGKLEMVRFLLDRGAKPYPPETPEIIEAWRRNRRPSEIEPKNEHLIDRCPFDKMDEMMELFREYDLPTETRWIF